MQFIKEFSQVLDKLYFNREDQQLLTLYSDKSNSKNNDLSLKLLKGIKSQKINNDEEACIHLYGTSTNKNRAKVSDLKYLLINKVSRLVCLVNQDKYEWDLYKKKYFECHKKLLVGKFLRYLQFKEGSKYFLEKAFKIATQFEFYDLSANAATFLTTIFSISGNNKRYEYYKKAYFNAQKKWMAEQKAKYYYLDIATYHVKYSKVNQNNLKLLKNYLDNVKKIYYQNKTYNTYLYLTRLASFYYELNFQFNKVHDTWESFECFIAQKPEFYLTSVQAESYLKMMSACLNLRAYQRGEHYGQKAAQKFEKGKLNWFIFHEYYYMLMMHKGDFDTAHHILNSMMKHPLFEQLPEVHQEKWLLFKGFLQFAMEARLDPAFSQKHANKKPLKLYKLINQMPTQSKDKHGVNTIILILKFLFMLNRKDIDTIVSLQEPLRQYRYRYLRFKNNQKMNLFVKMLLKIPKKEFSAAQVQTATQQDYDQLIGQKFRYQGGYEDLEVIPYERLWHWILSNLRN